MGPMTRRFEIGDPAQVMNDARVLKRNTYFVPIPDNAVPFFATGSVATPAFSDPTTLNNQVELCEYQCPIGWEGFLMGIMLFITGDAGTFITGSGDVIWSVDIDRPLASPLATGRWLPGYSAVARTLGDLSEPWPVARELRGWRMKTGETYRAKGYTAQNVNTGSPSFLHGSLQGMVWPKC